MFLVKNRGLPHLSNISKVYLRMGRAYWNWTVVFIKLIRNIHTCLMVSTKFHKTKTLCLVKIIRPDQHWRDAKLDFILRASYQVSWKCNHWVRRRSVDKIQWFFYLKFTTEYRRFPLPNFMYIFPKSMPIFPTGGSRENAKLYQI